MIAQMSKANKMMMMALLFFQVTLRHIDNVCRINDVAFGPVTIVQL